MNRKMIPEENTALMSLTRQFTNNGWSAQSSFGRHRFSKHEEYYQLHCLPENGGYETSIPLTMVRYMVVFQSEEKAVEFIAHHAFGVDLDYCKGDSHIA